MSGSMYGGEEEDRKCPAAGLQIFNVTDKIPSSVQSSAIHT